ncbi:MAG: hypothetical protein M1457_12565 [bacterium]|nr:hypothetical protein [bacterium]
MIVTGDRALSQAALEQIAVYGVEEAVRRRNRLGRAHRALTEKFWPGFEDSHADGTIQPRRGSGLPEWGPRLLERYEAALLAGKVRKDRRAALLALIRQVLYLTQAHGPQVCLSPETIAQWLPVAGVKTIRGMLKELRRPGGPLRLHAEYLRPTKARPGLIRVYTLSPAFVESALGYLPDVLAGPELQAAPLKPTALPATASSAPTANPAPAPTQEPAPMPLVALVPTIAVTPALPQSQLNPAPTFTAPAPTSSPYPTIYPLAQYPTPPSSKPSYPQAPYPLKPWNLSDLLNQQKPSYPSNPSFPSKPSYPENLYPSNPYPLYPSYPQNHRYPENFSYPENPYPLALLTTYAHGTTTLAAGQPGTCDTHGTTAPGHACRPPRQQASGIWGVIFCKGNNFKIEGERQRGPRDHRSRPETRVGRAAAVLALSPTGIPPPRGQPKAGSAP